MVLRSDLNNIYITAQNDILQYCVYVLICEAFLYCKCAHISVKRNIFYS